jgi:glycosyltransferase involved in cell wall biosynthesis
MMGAYFGPESISIGSGKENPKGFWERRDVRKMCDALLHGAGADWWKLSGFAVDQIPAGVKAQGEAQFRTILDDLNAHRPWVIKEPRLCLLFPVLKSQLDAPVCIHVYRDPIEVARSLQRRNGFSLNAGLALWELYNRSAFNASQGVPRVLVSYRDLVADPIATTTALYKQLTALKIKDLSLPSEDAVNWFIDSKLYRERSEVGLHDDYLSRSQSELATVLEDARILGLARIPRLSQGARDTLSSFEGTKRKAEELNSEVERLGSELAALEAERQNKNQQIETFEAQLRENKASLQAKETELQELRPRFLDTERAMSQAQETLATLEAEKNAKNQQLKTLEEKAARLTNELSTSSRRIQMLVEWMESLEHVIGALLNSRRWKTGNMLGEVRRRLLRRPRVTMPVDCLSDIFDQFNAWKPPAQMAKNKPRIPSESSASAGKERSNELAAARAKLNLSLTRRLSNIGAYKGQIAEYVAARAAKTLQQSKVKKIVIYTAISGNYDSVKLPERPDSRFDYVLFTDTPAPDTGIYQVRPITYFHVDPTRAARFVKTHPHILLEGYDIAIWVDSNIMILGDIYPLVEVFLASGKAVAAVPHPLRKSIYEELEACIRLKKDDAEIMRQQLSHYRSMGFDSDHLIESNLMMFNLKNNLTRPFLDTWWREIERYSKRDQLSLNYALKQTGVVWHRLTEHPNSIRDHPLFAFVPHDGDTGPARTLTDALRAPMVDPNADSPLPDMAQERARSFPLSYLQRLLPTRLIPSALEKETQNKKQTRNQKQKDQLRISLLRIKLLELGFRERAFAELQKLATATDSSKPYLQKLAAWELALWHANKYSNADAEQCLRYLLTVTHDEKDQERLRQATVLAAECYDVLGLLEAGKKKVKETLSVRKTADLFLAAANLEATISGRIHYINKALEQAGVSTIALNASAGRPPYDCIRPREARGRSSRQTRSQKVSVIIPVHNAEETIQIALESILLQSWENLELLVVDDCSTDSTVDVIKAYESKDSRIHLLKLEANQGPYVARNMGLKMATGDFVTCSDADDWSHPEKIEQQVLDLIANEHLIGNTSMWARMTNDLKSYRRGSPGHYIQTNISSLMLRRERFIKALGSWDSVRFGADTELWIRIKKRFGENSVKELPYLLSFGRSSEESLTENTTFGYPGYLFGARREYKEAYRNYHRLADTLYYPFPQQSRPFAVPENMKPGKRPDASSFRHLHLVVVSDFRLPDNAEFSVALIRKGMVRGVRVALIQIPRYDVDPRLPIGQDVRALMDGDSVEMLVHGEEASCDNLIVKDPAVLHQVQTYIPHVKARNVSVVVDRLPVDESQAADPIYDFRVCAANLEKYFGSSGLWFPANSSIRDSLNERFCDEVKAIRVAPEDFAPFWDDASRRLVSPSSKANGLGEAREDEWIAIIDVKDVGHVSYDDPDGTVVVMPSIDTQKGLETARILVKRAGMKAFVFVVEDTLRQGLIKTLNDTAARLDVKYLVYLAEDAYPGRDWLRSAYLSLEKSGNGLLGFNDGKWKGRIASFGMIRTEWVKSLYGGPIFYPGYIAHKADNELTVIARALNTYVYEPNSTLVEYDPQKDCGGSNPKDDSLFRERYVRGFDGLVPFESLLEMAKEYKVKLERDV